MNERGTVDGAEYERLYLENQALKNQARKLLSLLTGLDPNAGHKRHPDWPMSLEGDEDALRELGDCLNAIQALL